MSAQPTVIWTEIPVTDLDSSIEFYNRVLGWTLTRDDSGPNPMAMFGSGDAGVHGHLYPGKPAASGTGNTIHLAVPDSLSATVDRCKDAGGKVLTPPIEIPPGSFVYVEDPDGNSIGLFEPKAG